MRKSLTRNMMGVRDRLWKRVENNSSAAENIASDSFDDGE